MAAVWCLVSGVHVQVSTWALTLARFHAVIATGISEKQSRDCLRFCSVCSPALSVPVSSSVRLVSANDLGR